MKGGGQELQARRSLSHSGTDVRTDLQDVAARPWSCRANHTRTHGETRTHARTRARNMPALLTVSRQKQLELTLERLVGQLGGCVSPLLLVDGWCCVSPVDFGGSFLIPKKQASV